MKMFIFSIFLSIICSASEAVTLGQKNNDVIANFIRQALVEAPKDQDVCFSPGGDCDIKLEKFIHSAQNSVDVAIYDINLQNVVDELVAKSQHISVRIIVDKRQSKGKRSLVPFLIKSGVNVRYGRQRGVQHDKFTIVDNKMVEAGSFNYTNHASKANNENQFYNANSYVVSQYHQQFEKMWERATIPQSYQKTEPGFGQPDLPQSIIKQ